MLNVNHHSVTMHSFLDNVECTSLVTRIAQIVGCFEGAQLTNMEGEAPALDLGHFMQAHILRVDRDNHIFMLYSGYIDEL